MLNCFRAIGLESAETFTSILKPLQNWLSFVACASHMTWQLRILKSKKSNLYYTRVVMPQRVKSGAIHLRSFAPGQHSFEETSQLWRAASDTVSDLTGPIIKFHTSGTDSDVFYR